MNDEITEGIKDALERSKTYNSRAKKLATKADELFDRVMNNPQSMSKVDYLMAINTIQNELVELTNLFITESVKIIEFQNARIGEAIILLREADNPND